MPSQEVEPRKQLPSGSRVLCDARRPELTRFANVPGRVVAMTYDGRALVQFDGADQGWHDLDPEFLRLEPSS